VSAQDGHTYRHCFSCVEPWCKGCRPCVRCGSLAWCEHDGPSEDAVSEQSEQIEQIVRQLEQRAEIWAQAKISASTGEQWVRAQARLDEACTLLGLVRAAHRPQEGT